MFFIQAVCLLRATCNVQRATCNVRRATCDVQRATCNVRRATCNVRRVRYQVSGVRIQNRSHANQMILEEAPYRQAFSRTCFMHSWHLKPRILRFAQDRPRTSHLTQKRLPSQKIGTRVGMFSRGTTPVPALRLALNRVQPPFGDDTRAADNGRQIRLAYLQMRSAHSSGGILILGLWSGFHHSRTRCQRQTGLLVSIIAFQNGLSVTIMA